MGAEVQGALRHCVARCNFLLFKKNVGESSSAATAKSEHFPSLSTVSYNTYLKLGTRKTVARDSNYQLKRISKRCKLASVYPTNILHLTVFSFQIRI